MRKGRWENDPLEVNLIYLNNKKRDVFLAVAFFII